MFSALKQHGCNGAVSKALQLAIATTCAKTEIAATQSWQILDYLLLHVSEGASVD